MVAHTESIGQHSDRWCVDYSAVRKHLNGSYRTRRVRHNGFPCAKRGGCFNHRLRKPFAMNKR